MMKADPFSHHPNFDTGATDNKDVIVLPSQLFANITALSLPSLSPWEEHLLQAQESFPVDIAHWTTPFSLTQGPHGLWTHLERIVIVADNTLWREVMAAHHDHVTTGHPGISKTLFAVEQGYWWLDMKNFI
jgi:Integrase zinc binding domain